MPNAKELIILIIGCAERRAVIRASLNDVDWPKQPLPLRIVETDTIGEAVITAAHGILLDGEIKLVVSFLARQANLFPRTPAAIMVGHDEKGDWVGALQTGLMVYGWLGPLPYMFDQTRDPSLVRVTLHQWLTAVSTPKR